MEIYQLKKIFTNDLKDEYPPEEISSFFNLLSLKFLQMSRIDAALNPQAEISDEDQKKFDTALLRLKNHEPIQYIIGETEFFGMDLRVNENVLIPRPETEELVQWILDEVKPSARIKILDIGTGSGCIAISLAKNLPQSRVSAIDISEKALEIARENSAINNTEVHFIKADILQQESLQETYDVIVSNPPYVRELEKKEMQRNVLEHELSNSFICKR
ncbi:peptide chain release factor N(5)-glutamine methyltransferase [Antarcticibacterium sp. 1MA-6-2]|uniref:peptide chain release factor N(5)-glutamine methyltransferase n=1 Tax=Antarcticibacterium sp. 1MA-6-2 TaxID=2908210 RepID=UPI0028834ADA|nr:peptide chain release factor N(5)-glutamine methyltransferase [Antarcticibacterium sp. 1MA-6-2]